MNEWHYSAALNCSKHKELSVSCLPNNMPAASPWLTPLCCCGVVEIPDNTLIRDHCTQRTHSREAAGLADLVLGNILLQIAEVSASSTSCCQWLKQNKPNTTGDWGSAVMRSTHFFFQACHLKTSSEWQTENSSFKRLTASFYICILCACLGACSYLTQQKHTPLLGWKKMREFFRVNTLILMQEPLLQKDSSST